jgi:hypothetical protein
VRRRPLGLPLGSRWAHTRRRAVGRRRCGGAARTRRRGRRACSATRGAGRRSCLHRIPTPSREWPFTGVTSPWAPRPAGIGGQNQ